MNKEELKCWFFDMLFSCYPVKHNDYPDSIFWYYSESFARKIKLCNLSGEELTLPNKIEGKCLFEQELKNKLLYCDYEKIWLIIYNELGYNYNDIKLLINNWLKDTEKLSDYTFQGRFGRGAHFVERY